jgi:hypothetical protein
MPSLIAIRDELIRGDRRALYLGWLATLPNRGRIRDDDDEDDENQDDDTREPPVPPGLAKPSGALRALADFLRIDPNLLEVAAAASAGEPPAAPARSDLARWVKTLPTADKDAYLTRFVAEEGDHALRAELANRFRETTAPRPAAKVKGKTSGDGRRTVAELLAARDALAREKSRRKAEEQARIQARREREEAEARTLHLDQLARREPDAWREVDQLIAAKKPRDYDRAVALLVDLRDLAARSGRDAESARRIQDLRFRHKNKPSLIDRLNAKNLGL